MVCDVVKDYSRDLVFEEKIEYCGIGFFRSFFRCSELVLSLVGRFFRGGFYCDIICLLYIGEKRFYFERGFYRKCGGGSFRCWVLCEVFFFFVVYLIFLSVCFF